ncbi:Fatty acid synthase [Halotydeus destructor]|nr:Fatty acid synthase [Halotydeus destructor]
MFVRLNADRDGLSGRPIFFLPPVEGDFNLMLPITKFIDRPIIGINWTSEVDQFETVADLGAHYVQKLRETYPDAQYDFVGYSYGGLIAYEMAVQLQQLIGEKSVKKLMLLDSSPSYMKSFTSGLQEKTNIKDADEGHVEMLLGFAAMANPMDSAHHQMLKESLLKMTNLDERTKSVAEFIQKSSGVDVNAKSLTDSAARYFRKIKMVHMYESAHKYAGEVKLIRATELGYGTTLAVEIEADYGLSKVCSGTVDTIVLDGDHKSFIACHAENIGANVESHFQYYAFA